MPNAFQAMQMVAETYDCTVVVGVRSKGTWFAASTHRTNGENVEVDAANATAAVKDLHSKLRSETERRLHAATSNASRLQRMLNDDPMVKP